MKRLYSSDQVLMISQMTLIVGKEPKQLYFNDFFWHPSYDTGSFIQVSFLDKEIVLVDIDDELKSRVKSFAKRKRFKIIEFYPCHVKGEHVTDNLNKNTMKPGSKNDI